MNINGKAQHSDDEEISTEKVNNSSNRMGYSAKRTGLIIYSRTNELTGLSAAMTPKWSRDLKTPFRNTSKILEEALSGFSRITELAGFSAAMNVKWNKDLQTPFGNLSKVLGEALTGTPGITELVGLSSAMVPKWNIDLQAPLGNLSKVLGEALTGTPRITELVGLSSAMVPKWNIDLQAPLGNLSKVLGEALTGTSRITELAGFSAAMNAKWNKDLQTPFGNLSKVLGEALTGTSRITELADFSAALELYSQKSMDNTTTEEVIRDILEDIKTIDEDNTHNESNEATQNIEKRNTLLNLLVLIYFVMFFALFKPITPPPTETSTIDEISIAVTENFERIIEILNMLKVEAKIAYKDTNSLFKVDTIESVICTSILGSLVESFMIAFFQKIKNKSTKNCLAFDSIVEATKLIEAVVCESSTDETERNLMREILKKNLAMIKRNKTKVRCNRNGSITKLLNKNQLIVIYEKEKKWVPVKYYKDNNLEQGWVLSKNLKKFQDL